MKQPFSEADHISQTLQVDFDRMLRNSLEKHCSFPGLALLLGGLLWCTNAEHGFIFHLETMASLYLGRQRGEEYIFDDIGLSGLEICLPIGGRRWITGTLEFLTYFADFLQNPGRSDAQTQAC